jgi:transposase
MAPAFDALPDDVAALKAALVAEREKGLKAAAELAVANAKAAEDKALIAVQKLRIAKLERQVYGQRSERSARLIEQLSLEFEELAASATEDELAAEKAVAKTANVRPFTRRPSERNTFPEHLPRERVVLDPPTACECCGGSRLRKLGEDVTRTLTMKPREWKVIETVREKFTCRDCEKISQTPAPFHCIPRAWAGASLLAMIVFEKFGQHQPLNRQAERYALEGVPIALSTMADAVGASAPCSIRCADCLTPTSWRPSGCMATIRPYPCWRRARPTRVGFGPTCATTGRSPARGRRRRSSTTRAIAAANIRRRIWRVMPASCKPTPTTATADYTCPTGSLGRSGRRRAGSMPASVLRHGRH